MGRTERVAAATEDLLELIRSRPDLVEKISWWVEDDDSKNATVYSLTATLRYEELQQDENPPDADMPWRQDLDSFVRAWGLLHELRRRARH